MSLFGAIVVADLAFIFAGLFIGFNFIDTNGWDGLGIFSSLLMIVFLLFLLASF